MPLIAKGDKSFKRERKRGDEEHEKEKII